MLEQVLNSLLYLISENLGSLIGAGTALEDIVNEHKKKETRTTDRSKILWFTIYILNIFLFACIFYEMQVAVTLEVTIFLFYVQH